MNMECPVCGLGTLVPEGQASLNQRELELQEQSLGHPLRQVQFEQYVCRSCRRRLIRRNGRWTVMGVLHPDEPLPGEAARIMYCVGFVLAAVLLAAGLFLLFKVL